MPPDTSTNFFDGLGRLYNSQHVTPQGIVNVDTVLDAFAHPLSVSNPYFTKTEPTYGLTQPFYDALGRVYQATEQDGSIKSADFSAGNCTLSKDEAGTQRRTCSDALGRLVEVDEPNPGAGASQAQGNVIISGHEQTNPQPAASGTGWVTFAGAEGSTITDPCADQQPLPGHPPRSCPTTVWDTGQLTVTINGFPGTASYQQGSSPSTMATELASAFHNNPASPVDAVVDPANPAKVNFTAHATGLATNYSVALSPPGDFSFSGSSGPTLTGGRDATSNLDTGNVTITVNGVPYNTSFGGSDTDGSGIASRLAGLISAGPYANASAIGTTVKLTSKTAGPAGNYSLAASYTWNSASFAQPSFTTAADPSLAGGYNAGDVNNQTYVTLYQYDALGNLLCVEQHGNVTGTGCNASPASDATSPWRVRRFTYDSLSRLLTAHNPESGTISYTYDADGNLLQKTSPAPNQPAGSSSRRPSATAMTSCIASPAKPGRRNRVRWSRL